MYAQPRRLNNPIQYPVTTSEALLLSSSNLFKAKWAASLRKTTSSLGEGWAQLFHLLLQAWIPEIDLPLNLKAMICICQRPIIKSPCQGHPKSPLDRLACPVHPLLVYRIEDPIGRLSCPCTGHRISRSMSDLPKLDDMELRIAQIGGVVDCNEKPATIEISTEEAGGSSSATTQNPS